MIRRFWTICLYALLSICLFSRTSAKNIGSDQTENSLKDQKKYNYLLYLPKEYDVVKKKYPLIIYLHGSSQRGNDINKLKAYGPPQLVQQGRNFDFIIASPQCPAGVRNWSAENWFETMFAELNSKYEIDPERIYLTGVSMGGGGTFDLAKKYPDKFAALVPLCAWDSDVTNLCNIRHIPTWTFHGKQDEVVPVSETEEKVKKLRNCKGNIELTVLENDGHGIQWLYEKQDTYDIYNWMLKHKRRAK